MPITENFARGLGVTALTLVCMAFGFHQQEAMLRHRFTDFNDRVDAATEAALDAKEKRVRALEARVADMQASHASK